MGHPEDLLDEESQKEAVELVKCQDQHDRTWGNAIMGSGVRHERASGAHTRTESGNIRRIKRGDHFGKDLRR